MCSARGLRSRDGTRAGLGFVGVWSCASHRSCLALSSVCGPIGFADVPRGFFLGTLTCLIVEKILGRTNQRAHVFERTVQLRLHRDFTWTETSIQEFLSVQRLCRRAQCAWPDWVGYRTRPPGGLPTAVLFVRPFKTSRFYIYSTDINKLLFKGSSQCSVFAEEHSVHGHIGWAIGHAARRLADCSALRKAFRL